MKINYLGGKMKNRKVLHVFFATEYGQIDGWMPKENKLNELLELNDGLYHATAVWGYHLFSIRTLES